METRVAAFNVMATVNYRSYKMEMEERGFTDYSHVNVNGIQIRMFGLGLLKKTSPKQFGASKTRCCSFSFHVLNNNR